MINRLIEKNIEEKLGDNKAIILIGPRQVGKTTLLKTLAQNTNKKILWWNGDDADTRTELEFANATFIKEKIGSAQLLLIDEAQRIKNIGLVIKIIVDNIPTVKVIATGSSAFELANKINEPLTGRKWEYRMFPISTEEMINHTSKTEENRLLKHRLIYGYYPDIINNSGNEVELLKQLADSYLYKDLLIWENIQKTENLEKLIKALAFQVGQLVSINELAQLCSLDSHTVERYISLLQKAFIIFTITPFSRNLRNEIKKSRKIYFYDNGIRNAVINQFNPLELRNDKGALWENYLMSERYKLISYKKHFASRYFWRNHNQQEIDYIEEANGEIKAFEFKWSNRKKVKFPNQFVNQYNPSSTQVINQNNYLDFVLAV